jgi:GTPase KRas protein
MEPESYLLYVMGAGGVGKSCLTIQFIQGRFSQQYDPTIENSYSKLIEIDGHEVKLNILDTAGQEDFASLREAYMRQGQGFLLVFSLLDSNSFDEIDGFVNQIREICENKSVPIVLCGNKSDLEGWEVTEEDLKTYSKSIGVKYFITSAKLAKGVKESFLHLAKEMRKQNPKAALQENNKKVETPKAKENESSGGCCSIF